MTGPTRIPSAKGTSSPIQQVEEGASSEQELTAPDEAARAPSIKRSSLNLETGASSPDTSKAKGRHVLQKLLGFKSKVQAMVKRQKQGGAAEAATQATKRELLISSETTRMHAADKLLVATDFALNQPEFLAATGLFRLEPPKSTKDQLENDLANFFQEFNPDFTASINGLTSLIKHSLKASLSDEDKVAMALMAGIPSDLLLKGAENKAAVERVVSALEKGTLAPACTASFVNLMKLLVAIEANSATTKMDWKNLGVTPGKMMMPELNVTASEAIALTNLYQQNVGNWLQALVDPNLSVAQIQTLPQAGNAKVMLDNFIQELTAEMSAQVSDKFQTLVPEVRVRAFMTPVNAMAARKSALQTAPTPTATTKAETLYASVRHTTLSENTDFSDSDSNTESSNRARSSSLSSRTSSSSSSGSTRGGAKPMPERVKQAASATMQRLRQVSSSSSKISQVEADTSRGGATVSEPQASAIGGSAYNLAALNFKQLNLREINEIRMQIAQEAATPSSNPKMKKAQSRLHRSVLLNLDTRERSLFKQTEAAAKRVLKTKMQKTRAQSPVFSSDPRSSSSSTRKPIKKSAKQLELEAALERRRQMMNISSTSSSDDEK